MTLSVLLYRDGSRFFLRDDAWRFGHSALIVRFDDPLIEAFFEAVKRLLVRGLGGEVVHFVGVGLMIVEFKLGAGGGDPAGLDFVEFSFFGEVLNDGQSGVTVLDVLIILRVGAIRIEVMNELIAGVADGANAINGHVATVARGEDFRAGPGVFEKRLTVEEFGEFDAGGVERGGGNVEREDGVPAHGSGLDSAGPANEERNVRTDVIEPLFAAEKTAAVVAEYEDEGVVEQAVFLELIENDANLGVPVVHGVEIVGDFIANDGMVRIIRREFDFGGIDEVGLFAREGPLRPFVGRGEIDLGVEGLAGSALLPVRAVEGFSRFEIEIRLAAGAKGGRDFGDVGGEVPGVVETV